MVLLKIILFKFRKLHFDLLVMYYCNMVSLSNYPAYRSRNRQLSLLLLLLLSLLLLLLLYFIHSPPIQI